MGKLARLFSKYKSEAQMRRQAIEWAVRMAEAKGGKSSYEIAKDARWLMKFWLTGE